MSVPFILNFSHPLTDAQRTHLQELLGGPVQEQRLSVQVPAGQTLAQASRELLDSVGLTPESWQTTPLLVIPPGLAALAVTLLADIHGRSGHFPTLVVIRPVPDAPVTTYAVSEVLNLQALRDERRLERGRQEGETCRKP